MELKYLLKKQIQTLIPYEWEREAEVYQKKYNLTEIIRFDGATSRVPTVWNQFIRSIDAERAVTGYKDPAYFRLKKAVAKYEKVNPKMITVVNSGDEAIDVVTKAFLNQNDKVIISSPTYEMYQIQTSINGGKIIDIPLTSNWQLNAHKIIRDSIKRKVKIIFICSPNNPTGNAMAPSEIEKIIASGKSIVVIDEAYREFGVDNFNYLLDKYQNVVILRSLSKFGCIAGARVGYLLASAALSTIFDSIRYPMGVSYFSQELAILLLTTGKTFITGYIQFIKFERERMIQKYKDLGFAVFPSKTNFISLILPDDSPKLVEYLKTQGLFIRDLSNKKRLTGAVRLGIREVDENEKLFKTIKKYYEK